MNRNQNAGTKNLLLLLVWVAIAIGLRLTRLASKPPWTDEFSTLVFSLGNSFLGVPLDQAIALDVLLQPLQPNPTNGVTQVVHNLVTESNHPPLYFMLAHWWMQLWSPNSVGLVSVWAARAFPALLGAAAVPAIYKLGWLAFRSRLVSHLSAAMMAVSPYGIFLAQEARHYTLAILWVIASFACLVSAIRHIQNQKRLPSWLVVAWIGANFLGISTHYFFALTLCAEAIVLLILCWHQIRNASFYVYSWWQIGVIAVGTSIAGLVWLPVFLQNNYGSDLTDWIQSGDKSFIAWLSPIFQAIAAWITMLSLLPVEASNLPVVIAAGAVMIVFFLWALPQLADGFKVQLNQPATRSMTLVFAGIVASAIALFFFFTYALGIDLTRGARYNFVYFPAVMVLVGASLAVCWREARGKRRGDCSVGILPAVGERRGKVHIKGKQAVAVIWLMGLVSAITVVCNLGYQKYYRPDLLVEIIQKTSQAPILIATTHKTHVQIGEMMGIGREFKLTTQTSPQFLLTRQVTPNAAVAALQQTLKTLPRPLELWLVNFQAPVVVDRCIANPQSLPPVDGYIYQRYQCE